MSIQVLALAADSVFVCYHKGNRKIEVCFTWFSELVVFWKIHILMKFA